MLLSFYLPIFTDTPPPPLTLFRLPPPFIHDILPSIFPIPTPPHKSTPLFSAVLSIFYLFLFPLIRLLSSNILLTHHK
uniref:Uncharacterized protein n=1 Tax=Octopus bimaculoides TaxID=37653 RepID=A0A0L8GC25_OCTBM